MSACRGNGAREFDSTPLPSTFTCEVAPDRIVEESLRFGTIDTLDAATGVGSSCPSGETDACGSSVLVAFGGIDAGCCTELLLKNDEILSWDDAGRESGGGGGCGAGSSGSSVIGIDEPGGMSACRGNGARECSGAGE
jgi:hypothetical protein